MAKIVYNACYGGYSLSDAAIRRYAEIKGIPLYPESLAYGFQTWWTVTPEERKGMTVSSEDWYTASNEERAASNGFTRANSISSRDIPRNDPVLAQVVEELGEAANGAHANLKIEELPDGTPYRIDEYDGLESVETNDSYVWSVA